jgi:hypothetical protein
MRYKEEESNEDSYCLYPMHETQTFMTFRLGNFPATLCRDEDHRCFFPCLMIQSMHAVGDVIYSHYTIKMSVVIIIYSLLP